MSSAASNPMTAQAVCEAVLGPTPFVVGIVIRSAGLAPSAIGVLHHAQPFRCLLHHGS